MAKEQGVMTRTAFYPGSFDPLTFGHLDIIHRASALCDRLVVGVGAHHEKRALFSVTERMLMFTDAFAQMRLPDGFKVEVISFDGLMVAAADSVGADIILRGLRDASDFAYESQMAGMNAKVAQPTQNAVRGKKAQLETVFLVSSSGVRHIAAKFVRQIASMGGDVTAFVPDHVVRRLNEKFG